MKGFGARLLIALLVLGCAGIASAADALPAARQILVMLHTPPAHYRPGNSYGGNYDDQSGRLARRRSAEKLAHEYGLTLLSDWPMPALGVDCYVMESTTSEEVAEIVKRISGDPRAEWVQPLNAFQTLGTNSNDPLYSVQPSAVLWHLDELHSVSTGRGVRVAIVDSGVDSAHPDLAGRIDVRRNFVDAHVDAIEAHGTQVAGIIGARADNGMGIAGIAPEATLLALRACWEVSAEQTLCNSFTLAKALQFAIDDGARVINLSLSGPQDKLLGKLLDVALTRGATVVTAADPHVAGGGFPASHPGVLAVSPIPAVAANEQIPSYPRWPVLMAPGRDIPTTVPGAGWDLVSGPSFAAAHVAGLVALVKQLSPSATMRDERSWSVFPAVGDRRLAGTIDACGTLRHANAALQCPAANDQAMRATW